jgi:predicted SprT family Zn-dependent metalloprotease
MNLSKKEQIELIDEKLKKLDDERDKLTREQLDLAESRSKTLMYRCHCDSAYIIMSVHEDCDSMPDTSKIRCIKCHTELTEEL